MEEYRLHVNGCITKQNIKVKLRINVFFETTFNLYGCIYIYIYGPTVRTWPIIGTF